MMSMPHCTHRWTDKYLELKMGTRKLTVDITPHGLGDAVLKVQTKPDTEEKDEQNTKNTKDFDDSLISGVEDMFVKPLEVEMQMSEFFQVHPLGTLCCLSLLAIYENMDKSSRHLLWAR